MNSIPFLDCPMCSEPLIPAHGRGRRDEDENLVRHRDNCNCRWCDWIWFEEETPVKCECGTSARVRCDDSHAYVVKVG